MTDENSGFVYRLICISESHQGQEMAYGNNELIYRLICISKKTDENSGLVYRLTCIYSSR